MEHGAGVIHKAGTAESHHDEFMTEINFTPSGPVRPGSVYIGYKLSKAFNMLARAQHNTRDELVDAVLSVWLNHNHPALVAFLEKHDAEEQDFLKTLEHDH